jgi:hypothetical protein
MMQLCCHSGEPKGSAVRIVFNHIHFPDTTGFYLIGLEITPTQQIQQSIVNMC